MKVQLLAQHRKSLMLLSVTAESTRASRVAGIRTNTSHLFLQHSGEGQRPSLRRVVTGIIRFREGRPR